MKKENLMLFWAMIFLTPIVATVWSVMFLLTAPRPLFVVFLILNILVLITNITCFFLSRRKK